MNSPLFRMLCLAASLLSLGALSACDSRTAEQKGGDMATEKIDLAKGIGDALEKKGGIASEAVATGIGAVYKGVEKGASKSGRTIATDDTLAKAGLKVTRVQDAPPAEEGKKLNALDLYVVSDAEVHGKLRVLTFDLLGNEISRTSIDLKRAADEGKYERLMLDELVLTSKIAKLEISFKPHATLAKK